LIGTNALIFVVNQKDQENCR